MGYALEAPRIRDQSWPELGKPWQSLACIRLHLRRLRSTAGPDWAILGRCRSKLAGSLPIFPRYDRSCHCFGRVWTDFGAKFRQTLARIRSSLDDFDPSWPCVPKIGPISAPDFRQLETMSTDLDPVSGKFGPISGTFGQFQPSSATPNEATFEATSTAPGPVSGIDDPMSTKVGRPRPNLDRFRQNWQRTCGRALHFRRVGTSWWLKFARLLSVKRSHIRRPSRDPFSRLRRASLRVKHHFRPKSEPRAPISNQNPQWPPLRASGRQTHLDTHSRHIYDTHLFVPEAPISSIV